MPSMLKKDVTTVVNAFTEEHCSSGLEHRYLSFDFCYHYFNNTKDLTQDYEKSCYVLWGYLASWGMLRGSSFLLKKNPVYFKELIEYYNSLDTSYWELDIGNQPSSEYQEKVLELFEKTKEIVIKNNEAHRVLITKILLGVFGCIPAFDRYFCETFKEISHANGNKCRFTKVNVASLSFIEEFYQENAQAIDALHNRLTVKGIKGEPTKLHYTRAKIIDMYGFQCGLTPELKRLS